MAIQISGLKELKQEIQSFLGELKNYDLEAKIKECRTRLPELEERRGELSTKIRDLEKAIQKRIQFHQELAETSSTEESQLHKDAIRLYTFGLTNLVQGSKQEINAASRTLSALSRVLLMR